VAVGAIKKEALWLLPEEEAIRSLLKLMI